jgi:hypothetical protein
VIDDITAHNEDATAHADLLALKVDAETYNTAITSINTTLDGKENTGVAQGLVTAHNASSTAHEALFETKADKTELESYLPLSGGTMTGSLLTTNENSFLFENTTGKIGILFNSSWTNGASIWLYGKDHAQAGCFEINAHNGTTSCQLNGKADGTLTWGGADIVTDAGTGLEKLNNILALASIITAGNAGPTGNTSPGYGGTFTVPYFTFDAQGRITGTANRIITMPAKGGGATAYITAASVTATRGYIKFSNKLLIQWGYETVSGSVALKTLTFPTAFANTTYTFVRTSGNVTNQEASQIRAYTGDSGTRATSSIKLYAGGNASNYSWIAIGTCS